MQALHTHSTVRMQQSHASPCAQCIAALTPLPAPAHARRQVMNGGLSSFSLTNMVLAHIMEELKV